MNEESLIFKIYGNSPPIKIVNFLLDFPKNDFTQKEILEELGMSKTTFYKYFGNLLDNGMVTINRRIANSKLYRINLYNPIIQNMKKSVSQMSTKIADEQLKKSGKIKNIENIPRAKYQIFDEVEFSRGREVLGDLIVHGMITSGGTDVDWMIEHNGLFLILEFKGFHNDKIRIPKGQMKSYEQLHDKLNRSTKCYLYIIGCDDIDFSNPDASVWIFEMNQWKRGAIPHNSHDISHEAYQKSNPYIIYREYMEEIKIENLRALIDSDLNFKTNKFKIDPSASRLSLLVQEEMK